MKQIDLRKKCMELSVRSFSQVEMNDQYCHMFFLIFVSFRLKKEKIKHIFYTTTRFRLNPLNY